MSHKANDEFVDGLRQRMEQSIAEANEGEFHEILSILIKNGYTFASSMYKMEWDDAQETAIDEENHNAGVNRNGTTL